MKQNLIAVDPKSFPTNFKKSHFDKIKNDCLSKYNLTVEQLIELKHDITKRVLSIPGVLINLGILNYIDSDMNLDSMEFFRSQKSTGVNTIVNVDGRTLEFHNHMDTLLTQDGFTGRKKDFFYREVKQYVRGNANFAGTLYFDASETVVLFIPASVIRDYLGKDLVTVGNEWKMTADWSSRYMTFSIPCEEIYAFGNISQSHREKFKTFDYSVNDKICKHLMKYIKETPKDYLDKLRSLQMFF